MVTTCDLGDQVNDSNVGSQFLANNLGNNDHRAGSRNHVCLGKTRRIILFDWQRPK